MFLSKNCHEKLDIYFENYGKFIARRPWTVILIALIINGMLGLHITSLQFESDMEKLYTPTDSEADFDREKVNYLFADQSRTHFYPEKNGDHVRYVSVIVSPRSSDNILDSIYQVQINKVHQFIINATTLRGSKMFNYTDLCAKRNEDCVVSGSFLFHEDFWLQIAENNSLCDMDNCSLNGTEDIRQHIGGIKTKNDSLTSAKAIKLVYFMRSDSEFDEITIQWERDLIKMFKNYKNDVLNVFYSRSDSLNDEINDNAVEDITYFSLTFSMMISYTSFVTSSGNCVSQRVWLGRAGVIASGLSIMASFGFSTFAGVDFVNIVGVVPFLILGLGINGTFILLSGLADAPLNNDTEKRIGVTIRISWMAMTISALSNIIMFSVGMTSSFMVIRYFCFYAVFAVLFCYLNMMTFFVACMTLHEKRVASRRHCCTCQPIEGRDEMRRTGHGCCFAYCCGGSQATSRQEQESLFEKFPRFALPKIILFPPMKIAIAVFFIIMLGFSTWGSVHFRQGFVEQDLLSRNSYYFDYLNVYENYFKTTYSFSIIFVGKMSYSSESFFSTVQNLATIIQSDVYVDRDFKIDWYSAFHDYLRTNFDLLTENNFTHILRTKFLPRYDQFANDIAFSADGQIKASMIYLKTNDIRDSYEKGSLMKRLREISKTSNMTVIIYSPSFIYFEQYTNILSQTFQTIGGIAGTVLVLCLILPHPILIVCFIVSIVLTLVGLFGFMYYWVVPLTPIATLYIITGIGYSIDFSAHVCNAYTYVDGLDQNYRINEAIVRAGVPVFSCSIAAIIGIVMSLITKSYAFLTFFQVMLLIVILSLGHSLFLVPVVLSVIGPSKRGINYKDRVQKDIQKLKYADNLGFIAPNSDIYTIKL